MDNDKLAELILSVHTEAAATRKAVEAQNEWIKEHGRRLNDHDEDIETLHGSRQRMLGGLSLLGVVTAVLAAFSEVRDYLPF